MSENAPSFSPLWSWGFAGAALDAVALLLVYAGIAAFGPLPIALDAWLVALGLMIVPWYVHVVALPIIFHGSSIGPAQAIGPIGRGIAFIAFSALVAPLLGICVSALVLGTIKQAEGGGPRVRIGRPIPLWIADVEGYLILLPIVAIVGAAIGFLLHVFRLSFDGIYPPGIDDQTRMRSDTLGGALAAALAGVGIFAADALGVFSRPASFPVDLMHPLGQTPRLPSLVCIGTIALLPHLLLIGVDRQLSSRR